MSNKSYLLNTPTRISDVASLQGEWLVVAEQRHRIPLPWLCMFREDDLRPCTIRYDFHQLIDGENERLLGKFRILNPSVSVPDARKNLQDSWHVFEGLFPDADEARQHWKAALAALVDLPLQYVTLDPTEILLMDDLKKGASELVLALQTGKASVEAMKRLAGLREYGNGPDDHAGLDGGFFQAGSFERYQRSLEDMRENQQLLAQLDKHNLVHTPDGFRTVSKDLSGELPPDSFWTHAELMEKGRRSVSIAHGKSTNTATDKNYYSTALTNTSGEKVRVKAFAGFSKSEGGYVLSTVTGKWFSARDFRDWYGVAGDGWIAPGATAADMSNFGSGDGFWGFWCENARGERFMATVPLPVPARNPLAPQLSIPEAIRKNAEALRGTAREKLGIELAYDEDGVKWLDGYINRMWEVASEETKAGLPNLLGSFLGECLVATLGGEWVEHPEFGWGVQLSDGSVSFPFSKVQKHLANGSEDSVLSFFQTTGILLTTTPIQVPHTHALRMQGEIDAVRASLGATPRKFNFAQTGYNKRRPPPWMPGDDALQQIFRDQDLLFNHGSVVWGAIVQANNLLFEPGKDDCPAMVVYAPDAALDADPDWLGDLASRLFKLKSTKPEDAQEARLAAMITDEMERGLGWTVPPSLTGGKLVKSTVVMVFREHLANAMLDRKLYPLLVHDSTPAVMIVPARYWAPVW